MLTWLALGLLVFSASACARPDWIERTLVTVDVTGVWRGNLRTTTSTDDVLLTLQQSGSKVTGHIVIPTMTAGASVNDPLEGTIIGDTLHFQDLRGVVIGEVKVDGDEMTGQGTFRSSGRFDLRRQP
jgi:hypothetical protein